MTDTTTGETTMTTMTSRYNGFCRKCNRSYAAGTMIKGERGNWTHLVCPTASAPAVQTPSIAASLVSIRDNNNNLTCSRCGGHCNGQWSCDANIAAKQPKPAPVAVTSEAQAPIAAFIVAAREYIKYPKVRFLAPNGGELLLSVAGEKSKAPGSIQVKVDDNWVGRIEPNGAVVGYALKNDAALLATLSAIAADPAKLAKEYGALRGHCSFCDKKLDDEGSKAHGYGPRCAKNFGLVWHKGGVKKLTQQVPVAA